MKKLLTLVLFFGFSAKGQGLSFLKDFAEKRKVKNENRKQKRQDRWDNEHVYDARLFGFALLTTVNENFAPNQYIGGLLTYNQARMLERGKKTHFFDSNFGAGFVTLPESMSPTTSINSRFGYSLLFKLNDLVQVGPQVSFITNARFNTNNENNSVLMEAFSDLAPRIRLKKDFSFFGDPLSVDYDLAIPLLSYGISLPTFNTSFGEDVTYGLFTLNRYQRFQSQLGLTLPPNKRFKNKNARIVYSWDLLRLGLNDGRQLVNATQNISFLGSFSTIK